MTLQDLLQELRRRRLILTYNRRGVVVLWAPNTHVPRRIRQAIRSHSHLLNGLLWSASIDVCASPDLHRQFWRYSGTQWFTCELCEMLLWEVS
jgi:hypothetical protein